MLSGAIIDSKMYVLMSGENSRFVMSNFLRNVGNFKVANKV